MIPGYFKINLVETLDYFKVNRVEYYSLYNFEKRQFRPGKLFGLRCLSVQSADFYYGVTFDETVALLKSGKVEPGKYIACDSLQVEDATCLICNGEGRVSPNRIYLNGLEKGGTDLKLYNYHGTVNTRSGISCREAGLETQSDIKTTKIITRWRDMPKSVIDLIWIKNLIGFVVEFSIYSKSVGLQNEQLLIWEIRKY